MNMSNNFNLVRIAKLLITQQAQSERKNLQVHILKSLKEIIDLCLTNFKNNQILATDFY